jgi:hypothetical protein
MSAHAVFVITFQPGPNVNGIRALSAALKALRRRYGLRVIAIRETPKG